MIYDWDLDELIRLRKFLKKRLREKSDLYNLKALKGEIFSLDDMISIMGKRPLKSYLKPVKRIEYMDVTKYFPKHNYQLFKKIPKDIKKVILDSKDVWFSTNDKYIERELKEIDLSDDELIELTYDFIKNIPTNDNFYLDLFDEIVNSKHKLLKLTNVADRYVAGCTYPINHPKYLPYIIIHRNNTILDFITLCHEFAHAAFFANEVHANYFIKETEGFYFEMLAINYLNGKVDKASLKRLKYDMFDYQYTSLFKLYLTDLAAKQLRKTNRIELDDLVKTSCEDGTMLVTDNSYLLDSLSDDSHYNSRYLFSYLVFLDLYELYLQDPEQSFSKLEDVRLLEGRDIIDKLRNNGITFFDDGYKNLQKTVDKINRY